MQEIDWNKYLTAGAMVVGGVALGALTVATAGAAGAFIGTAAAYYLGASAATVAVGSIATAVGYGVAVGVGVYAGSNAYEMLSDGYNPVRDRVFNGNQQVYDNVGTALNFIAIGYTAVGSYAMSTGVSSGNASNSTSEGAGSTPADQARSWQGRDSYSGIDDWENTTLPKGTQVWGGAPGQSNFYTTNSVMESVGNDATSLNQGLQISKGAYASSRPGMTLYETTKDITVATSKALANPQFGAGGLDQYFISDYQDALNPILSRIMTNR